jgi:hypothetical protein
MGFLIAQKPFRFDSPVCSGKRSAGIQAYFKFPFCAVAISGYDLRSQER